MGRQGTLIWLNANIGFTCTKKDIKSGPKTLNSKLKEVSILLVLLLV